MLATCRLTLVSNDRTLAVVTFADGHRIYTTVTNSAIIIANWINETVQDCTNGGRYIVSLEVACQRNCNIVLVQFIVRDHCLIYQLLHHGKAHPPREFYEFLIDTYVDEFEIEKFDRFSSFALRQVVFLMQQKLQKPIFAPDELDLLGFSSTHARFCFIGAGVEVVAYGLQREHAFSVRNTADLGDTAAVRQGREDLWRAGLERLAREVMQVEMEEPAEVWRSNLGRRDLSNETIAYACAKAYVASKLRRGLLDC
ncbi:uncharacterized protein LOC109714630 [Ananas comosus]|uniref:Uncharacterized protein LOC109714630 n=1 Tax=Ananas comosus TaxID=4615 RepID=A0A6P5FPB9_ANACO|nr:uncharacterized protein LOC109714630 [Ananas comosus]